MASNNMVEEMLSILEADSSTGLQAAVALVLGEPLTPVPVRRALHTWACDCAEHVLHLFELRRPHDDRPRWAIRVSRGVAVPPGWVESAKIAFRYRSESAEAAASAFADAMLAANEVPSGSAASFAAAAAMAAGLGATNPAAPLMDPGIALKAASQAISAVRDVSCAEACAAPGVCRSSCVLSRETEYAWQRNRLREVLRKSYE